MPISADRRNLSSDEAQSDDDKLTVPLKRKRGRPTKDGLPKAAVPKKAVIPRGRGRPRKSSKGRGRPKIQKLEVPNDEVENGYSSAAEEVEEEDDVEQSKSAATNAGKKSPAKGRGRAKKL